MAIFLKIETVVLYFPTDSVSGLGYNFISEAVKDSVFHSKNEENMLVLRYFNVHILDFRLNDPVKYIR